MITKGQDSTYNRILCTAFPKPNSKIGEKFMAAKESNKNLRSVYVRQAYLYVMANMMIGDQQTQQIAKDFHDLILREFNTLIRYVPYVEEKDGAFKWKTGAVANRGPIVKIHFIENKRYRE